MRLPDGVEGERFFEKNVARGARTGYTVSVPSSGSRGNGDTITYPLIDDVPALVWAVNRAALELHVPQWTVHADGSRNHPDRLVFDLDPEPFTGLTNDAKEQVAALAAACSFRSVVPRVERQHRWKYATC